MRNSAFARIPCRLPFALCVIVAAALAGCSQKKADDSSPSFAKQTIDQATSATQPNPIEITNQTMVYECGKCGTDYDKAGKCPADGSELVAMQVSYICPADHLPADHAGKCPRCNMDVLIQKTAMAANQ